MFPIRKKHPKKTTKEDQMAKKVVRFKDLKTGESFRCREYDPVFESMVDPVGGAIDYVKTSENMAVITVGPVWRFFHWLNDTSWIYEFHLDVEVQPLDVPIYPAGKVAKWFRPEEKYHKYKGIRPRTEKVLRFRDLKIGERFKCPDFDPIHDGLMNPPKGVSEYIKVNKTTAKHHAKDLFWRCVYRLQGVGWSCEFPLDVEVRRVNVLVSSVGNGFGQTKNSKEGGSR
jgi:hypothetical protein